MCFRRLQQRIMPPYSCQRAIKDPSSSSRTSTVHSAQWDECDCNWLWVRGRDYLPKTKQKNKKKKIVNSYVIIDIYVHICMCFFKLYIILFCHIYLLLVVLASNFDHNLSALFILKYFRLISTYFQPVFILFSYFKLYST